MPRKFFDYLGKNSLEIYVVQLFTLRFINPQETTVLNSPEGFTFFILDFLIVALLTYIVIELIKSNKALSRMLFAK